MRTFKIPNGAERNAGSDGYVLAIETDYGDRIYISGFPADAKVRVYKKVYNGRQETSFKVDEIRDRLSGGL